MKRTIGLVRTVSGRDWTVFKEMDEEKERKEKKKKEIKREEGAAVRKRVGNTVIQSQEGLEL